MLSLRPTVLALAAAGFAGLGVVLMHHRWRRRSWVTGPPSRSWARRCAWSPPRPTPVSAKRASFPAWLPGRASATVEALILSDPRLIQAKGHGPPSSSSSGCRFARSWAGGNAVSPQRRCWCSATMTWAHGRWRQRVRVSGRFDVADPADDVVAVFKPFRGARVESVDPGGWSPTSPSTFVSGLRDAVSGLPVDARGLLPGLVIGDTSRTPQSLTDAMLATGMTHLSPSRAATSPVVLVSRHGLVSGHRRAPSVASSRCAPDPGRLCHPRQTRAERSESRRHGCHRAAGSERLPAPDGCPSRCRAPSWSCCASTRGSRDPSGSPCRSWHTLGLLLFARPWVSGSPVFCRRLCRDSCRTRHSRCGTGHVRPRRRAAPGSVTAESGSSPTSSRPPWWGPPPWRGCIGGAGRADLSIRSRCCLGWLAAVPTLGIAWVARACATYRWARCPGRTAAPGAFLLASVSIASCCSRARGSWRRSAAPHTLGRRAHCRLGSFAAAWPTWCLVWPSPGLAARRLRCRSGRRAGSGQRTRGMRSWSTQGPDTPSSSTAA
jgi:competence protein ComEC